MSEVIFMKKKIFIIFIITIGCLVFLLKIFSKGHYITYEIKTNQTKFKIQEKYIRAKKTKNKPTTYFLAIQTKDSKFSYLISYRFKKQKKIIKQIKYYKDNHYECVVPIFSNKKALVDGVCKYNKKYYNYIDIMGKSKKIDQFVNNIDEYDKTYFQDQLDLKIKKDNIEIYKNIKYIPNTIIVENYKGIYVMKDSFIHNIKLFSKDVYKKKAKALNDKYYLIADYNQEFESHIIWKVNIINYKKEKIQFNKTISLNSYIQGTIDGKSYLFDRDTSIQYEINSKKNKIVEVENPKNSIKIYNRGNWDRINTYDAINKDIYFNYYSIKNNSFDQVDQVEGKIADSYYFYKKINHVYYVYRSFNQSKQYKQFLFKTNEKNRIFYHNDKIYYVDDCYLKMYSDLTGTKTIMKNDEFRFNDNLEFYVY